MTMMILPTRNEAWGYWGTTDRMESDRAVDVADAWRIACTAIATATGAGPEGVRDFLDSRFGRHFADEVANELHQGKALEHAIAATIARWMGWRIDRRTSRETGIPVGLPWLTGFATHFEILATADA